jgi:hypothetical protein
LEPRTGDSPQKNAGTKSEGFWTDVQIGVHRQRGEADIDPVEKIHGVAKREKGQEPDRRLAYRAPVMVFGHDLLRGWFASAD